MRERMLVFRFFRTIVGLAFAQDAPSTRTEITNQALQYASHQNPGDHTDHSRYLLITSPSSGSGIAKLRLAFENQLSPTCFMKNNMFYEERDNCIWDIRLAL